MARQFFLALAGSLASGRAFLALIAVALLVVSCGGAKNDTAAPASDRVGTGSVPSYQSSSELLLLPQVQVGTKVQDDVLVRLGGDGTWSLESSGPTRQAVEGDRPSAVLGAPGANTDLGSGQTDATLTVPRLHVDTRVFSNVAIKLSAASWAMVGTPQEVKALHMEDFLSNAALNADESHHVVLKSDANTAPQNVPLSLSAKTYRFCMDAQADGADTLTLFDPAGAQVFAMKAGDACATFEAQAGLYSMQHRYGGNGSAHALFMRNAANTTMASAQAARPGSVALGSPIGTATGAKRALQAMIFPGTEYWLVRRASVSASQANAAYLGYGGPFYSFDGQPYCSGTMAFGSNQQWDSRAYLPVVKNAFGTPVSLGAPMACQGAYSAAYAAVKYDSSQDNEEAAEGGARGNPRLSGPGLTRLPPLGTLLVYPGAFMNSNHPIYLNELHTDGHPGFQNIYFPGELAAFNFGIQNPVGDAFHLGSGASIAPAPAGRPPRVLAAGGLQAHPPGTPGGPGGPEVVTERYASLGLSGVLAAATNMAVALRYFPDGLPASINLGAGQVALFTGTQCSGAAVVTEAVSIPRFDATMIPRLAGLGASFQLGLQTSAIAYSQAGYAGESQRFNQLTCNTGGFGAGWPLASIKVSADVVTMVISTNQCEYCNLAGANLSGLDLRNARLRNADMQGLVLSNMDLSGADLRSATLQGAVLINTNLEGANLCQAQLNGSPTVHRAAKLDGAHLKNTNLANASLDGVSFSGASFYSSQAGSCQQTACGTYVVPTCASAYHASINNASFEGAYLSNVDMGQATGRAVNFNNATVLGVSFDHADLSPSNDSGVGTTFRNTSLQGTDFSTANLKFADFTGAKVDTSSCVQAKLPSGFGLFAGARLLAGSGSPACVAGQPAAPLCVQTTFTKVATAAPPTDCSNICADGSSAPVGPQNGSCSGSFTCPAATWAAPLGGGGNPAMPTSSCEGRAALCGDAFSPPPRPLTLCW
jgi:uncharacterized protein YjbI with pentapeptide repeats